MRNKSWIFPICAILAFLLCTCESPQKLNRNNPVDPGSPDFQSYSVPVLSVPSDGKVGTRYAIHWNNVYAEKYILDESKDQEFSNPTSYSVQDTIQSFTHTVFGERYYYRVRTNTGNKDSGWSNTLMIEVTGWTISGTVTGGDSVTVTLSGDAAETQTVNNGGKYSFMVAYGGNFTVTPIKTGYMFVPTNKSFMNITANQTQNFTATKQTFTLSGKITGADSVTVTLSGDSSATQTVNDGGTYSFNIAYGET